MEWDPVADGYRAGRRMDDGRWWCLMDLTFGRLRIVVCTPEEAGEHWCYSNPIAAIASYELGPEFAPEGWSRHMLPDGTFEYPERGGET